ncbi:unnamed protein product [Hymenolepis diminuta]|uniref:Uncharacterized protein n=1 Tax=Hymenolepis diminuta TaxID=6216 RepID=A0A0R3SBM6_HYMDI|nr:unnamed protein product [Hymenolepis diminuta]VUZ47156.1 unnamed protein product [Hymenolepis diminuta]
MEDKHPEHNQNAIQLSNDDTPDQSQSWDSDSVVVDLNSDPFREWQNLNFDTENVGLFSNLTNIVSNEGIRERLDCIFGRSEQPALSSQPKPVGHLPNRRVFDIHSMLLHERRIRIHHYPSDSLSEARMTKACLPYFPRDSLSVRAGLGMHPIFQAAGAVNGMAFYQQARLMSASQMNKLCTQCRRMMIFGQNMNYLSFLTPRRVAAVYNRRRRNQKASIKRRLKDIAQQFDEISLSDNTVYPVTSKSSDVSFVEPSEGINSMNSTVHLPNSTQQELKDVEKKLEEMKIGEK